MTVRRAVTSPQFIVLVMTNFFCCATHSGPIFHTVSYAEICGISTVLAVSIYSVEGIAGMFGRIGFGVIGDRFGAKNVLVTGLLVQAVGALGYYFASRLGEFYAVAALFGFIYAGIMPLYSVLVREPGAREFSDENDGHDHGRHRHGGQFGHGHRAGDGRLDI